MGKGSSESKRMESRESKYYIIVIVSKYKLEGMRGGEVEKARGNERTGIWEVRENYKGGVGEVPRNEGRGSMES